MDNLTPKINEHSIESIRSEIAKKIGPNPYFANRQTVDNTITDMDHHPYTRWFRGVYYSSNPIIMEREAGFRPIQDTCYSLVAPPLDNPQPDHCFEIPCTTTLPCYPKYLAKYADKERLDVMINQACIPQYR
jgi:hypothetical protein